MADFEHYHPQPSNKPVVKSRPHEKEFDRGKQFVLFRNGTDVDIEVHFPTDLQALPNPLELPRKEPGKAAKDLPVQIEPLYSGIFPCQSIVVLDRCPACGAKGKFLTRKPAWPPRGVSGADGGEQAGSVQLASDDAPQDGDPVIIIRT